MKSVFISDCEGPISKNDNAFEITSHFIPAGDKVFTIISKYDDVVADVLKRPDCRAGNTLKLILPLLKAYSVTDSKMRQFSNQSLAFIVGVREALHYVRNIAYAFIVSTSYEHYIRAVCQAIDFPYENTYCTRLSLDGCSITEEEKIKLKKIVKEIAYMPMIDIPSEAKTIKDFSEKNRETIQRLDEIFLNEIASMKSGRIFSEVKPIGGSEKAESVKEAVRKAGLAFKDVMYVGDSITDVEAMRLVKDNGGLAVSFNGNQYAMENSEIAILSGNSIITAMIADVFSKFGKQKTLALAENWKMEEIKKDAVNQALLNHILNLGSIELPQVSIISKENMQTLVKESSDFRKKVRGEAIGKLG